MPAAAEDIAVTVEPARVSPWLPCLLAWFLPGLGHYFLGKRDRGVAFFIVVLAALAIGLASDGAASIVDPDQPLSYLATFDNIALGPLDLIGRQRTFGRIVYRLPGDAADPQRLELTNSLRKRVESVTYEYGNTFLLTAGLMNILLILDVFDIATGRKN